MASRRRKVRTSALLSLGVASIALMVAGCGGGSKSSGKTSTPTTPAAATSATLALGKTDLGKVLVGTGGRTLYLFEKDKGP
jgi:predicted lipoprotein with Yx(FWY)xxD motif